MPIADFCNGSMTPFNDTYRFLPGENVTITCSLPTTGMRWHSSQFVQVLISSEEGPSGEALGGAIVFNLTSAVSEPPCTTSTATITNIQEQPFQDLDLTCYVFGLFISTLNIDVIGKYNFIRVDA